MQQPSHQPVVIGDPDLGVKIMEFENEDDFLLQQRRSPTMRHRIRALMRRMRYGPFGRLRNMLFFLGALLLFGWIMLPYDNLVRLGIRFNVNKFQHYLNSHPVENWLFAPPAYPVDLAADTVVIVKTGYGTRQRANAWFEALSASNEFRDFLVIADYASKPGQEANNHGTSLPIHNVVNQTLSSLGPAASLSNPRVAKYLRFAQAIENGEEEEADQLAKYTGWEIDALKFISGLELAYSKFPNKKWYLLVDDDTYLVQPSLKPLLAHLDSEVPYYIGNAVGDFRIRFAHGGSGIILSQGAMSSLILDNPHAVRTAHLESLSETWGDRLLARTLIKAGVYLEEEYNHLFSGEPPRWAKIRPDRFCCPVVTFHGLGQPEKMHQAGESLRNVSKPLLWSDIWDVYGMSRPWRQSTLTADDLAKPIQYANWDHAGGSGGEVAVAEGVAKAEECGRKCYEKGSECMAWTWEMESKRCNLSPWMIVGEKVEGKVSGPNGKLARELEMVCLEY
ncbi:hypothetical protein QBC32DRAFT_347893 [Pseudoneurospora amorphoporcata]|uniref:N-acetylgalactosaminide beta-1,3-galactosyltransferase n=1 Tax=Pseudoneurospora amorphoporcata TaxID=241081 RepID=A0AAN6NQ27_9PEZI|nr:hypothetical protein QBC32DRAFT_347893 [Pseudoneurospora amorphoporcata]